jgi:hypothetical protein
LGATYVTDLVIKAVETMAKEQGIKMLKLTGRNKISIYPADWVAAVDYKQNNNENNNEHDNNDGEYRNREPNYEFNDELDDEEAYDRICQDTIDKLMAEPGQEDDNTNPTNREQQQDNVQDREQQQDDVQKNAVQPNELETAVTDDETDNATVDTTASRKSRARSELDRLMYYQSKGKHVISEDEEQYRLEQRHNLLTQEHPNCIHRRWQWLLIDC